jgi:hypothetical protein
MEVTIETARNIPRPTIGPDTPKAISLTDSLMAAVVRIGSPTYYPA